MSAERKPLTPRQAECLEFIRAFIAEKHYPPSIREIGRALGIGSTNGVTEMLGWICNKGWIMRTTHVARGLRVLP